MIEAINLFTAAKPGDRFDVGAAAGSSETASYIYDIAPGGSSCPYHYEYVEEWLLVIAGTVTVRTPEGEQTLDPGDLVCFPAGPDGAHKIMNKSDSPARTLLLARAGVPAVSVYPDSNKIGVWPGDVADELLFVRDTAVPWSHGEDRWDKADRG